MQVGRSEDGTGFRQGSRRVTKSKLAAQSVYESETRCWKEFYSEGRDFIWERLTKKMAK